METVYYTKYHGMGNDYIIIDPNKNDHIRQLSKRLVQQICDGHYGAGSDGIVFGPMSDPDNNHTKCMVRMYNPDGGEIEKSGNGLRIICKYLYDQYRTSFNIQPNEPFYIKLYKTAEIIKAKINLNIKMESIQVDIGKPRFDAKSVPCNMECDQVLNKRMIIDGINIIFSCVNVGNPHCVILMKDLRTEMGLNKKEFDQNVIQLIKKLGPKIENNLSLFPQRINVQFMDIIDDENIKIYIWERGVGYTLSSGTSSSGTSAIAHKLGLVKSNRINVNMEGGVLVVDIDHENKCL